MYYKQIKVIFQFNFTLTRKALPNELNWEQMIEYMITGELMQGIRSPLRGELPVSPVSYQRCSTNMYPETLKLIRTPRSFKVDKKGTLILRYDLSTEEANLLDVGIHPHKWTLGEGELPLKSSDVLSLLGID